MVHTNHLILWILGTSFITSFFTFFGTIVLMKAAPYVWTVAKAYINPTGTVASVLTPLLSGAIAARADNNHALAQAYTTSLISLIPAATGPTPAKA